MGGQMYGLMDGWGNRQIGKCVDGGEEWGE
jgi:hypothetical protein